MSAPSLHIESTDSMITVEYSGTINFTYEILLALEVCRRISYAPLEVVEEYNIATEVTTPS